MTRTVIIHCQEQIEAAVATERERCETEIKSLRAMIGEIDRQHAAKLAAERERLMKLLDECAKPTPEQLEQMETGIGAIFTSASALKLGMKTAIGNVKRAMGMPVAIGKGE